MEKQDMTAETKAEWPENGDSREPMMRRGTEQEGRGLPTSSARESLGRFSKEGDISAGL